VAGGPAARPGSRAGRLGRRGLFGLGVPGRLELLGLFQSQQELVLGQALGAAAEAVTLESLDDLAQPLALGPLLQEHRLEQARVVGKPGSRRGHVQIRSDLPDTYHNFGVRGRTFFAQLGTAGTVTCRGACTRFQSSPSSELLNEHPYR
jgi:hypothetical protein